MTMIYACIAPHDGNLIPEAVDDRDRVSLSRKAMQDMGKRLQSLKPEVIVIIDPHGFRVHNAMSICIAEKALSDWSQDVKLEFDLNPGLAHAIADEATNMEVPVARYIYGASGGASCFIPLDWGAVIPLYFMGHQYEPKPTIIHISPMKNLSYQVHYDFGIAIGRVVREAPERIAIIASADQGHAHSTDGPYGYDPASARYDAQMQELIKRQALDELLSIDPGFVEAAKPDSLWPTLILAGALSQNPAKGKLLSYEVDQYFGILCAEYLI